jgi:hypothetical protein
MAVLRSVQKLTCPHCGKVQARGHRMTGKVACKQCKKLFTVAEGTPRAKAKSKSGAKRR